MTRVVADEGQVNLTRLIVQSYTLRMHEPRSFFDRSFEIRRESAFYPDTRRIFAMQPCKDSHRNQKMMHKTTPNTEECRHLELK